MDDLLIYNGTLDCAKNDENLMSQWICLQNVDVENLSPRYTLRFHVMGRVKQDERVLSCERP